MSEKIEYTNPQVEIIDVSLLEEISALAGTCSKGTSTSGGGSTCSNR